MINPLILLSTRMILSISWIVAFQELVYSADLPGDGITAAIVLLVPLMLQYVVLGRRLGTARLPVIRFYYLLIAGTALLLIVLCGPLLAGGNLLQSYRLSFSGYTLKSSFLFETGVFMMIIGAVVTALVGYREPD